MLFSMNAIFGLVFCWADFSELGRAEGLNEKRHLISMQRASITQVKTSFLGSMVDQVPSLLRRRTIGD